jgi:L-ascorbate metabolism protein UlaG (beta-lactamase superfamily)
VYHPGDTVLFPEMQPGMTDVLLIPVRINDQFRIEDAAAIVNQINPRLSIPINWDGKKESISMIEEFKKMCISEVEVLKPKP